jgi:hypothetical protein
MYPGTLGYLVGRRNAGKSALSTQLTYHAAMLGFRTLHVSLEMPRRYVLARMLGQQSGAVKPKQILAYLYGQTADEIASKWMQKVIREQIDSMKRELAGRLVIREDLRTVAELDDYLSSQAEPFHFVLLDQMQHIIPPPGSQEGWAGMASNSRALVTLAMKHQIAILAPCQVNRTDGKDKDEDAYTMPRLNEIKGGSGLEHDCEYSWNICPLDANFTTLRLNVPKNRGLPGLEIRLDHDPNYNLTKGPGYPVPHGGAK